MPEIGFPELLVLGTLALLVLGPERLPEIMRTIGRWYGTLRQAANRFRMELDQEVSTKEIRQTISDSRRAANELEAELKSATNLSGMVSNFEADSESDQTKSNHPKPPP